MEGVEKYLQDGRTDIEKVNQVNYVNSFQNLIFIFRKCSIFEGEEEWTRKRRENLDRENIFTTEKTKTAKGKEEDMTQLLLLGKVE